MKMFCTACLFYEDKKGNISTSSESATVQSWVLYRYGGKTVTSFKDAAGKQ